MIATKDPFVGYFVRFDKDVIEKLSENREFLNEFDRLMRAKRFAEAARHAADAPITIAPPNQPDDVTVDQLARAFALARQPWVDEAMSAALHEDTDQAMDIACYRPSWMLVSRHLAKRLGEERSR